MLHKATEGSEAEHGLVGSMNGRFTFFNLFSVPVGCCNTANMYQRRQKQNAKSGAEDGPQKEITVIEGKAISLKAQFRRRG